MKCLITLVATFFILNFQRYTAQAAPAPTPKTGQTTSYYARDDGALQPGVALPSPRFTDNGNGTVADNLTGLIWLKNADCFGPQNWDSALVEANTLASGACGLSDGSKAGDWHLPNKNELWSLVDYGSYAPALSAGHPFTVVQADSYYSSSTYSLGSAWGVYMTTGYVEYYGKSDDNSHVWPVRSGQSGSSGSLSLSVSKTGGGIGTVTSATGGINCGSTCSASITTGTSVTITATPDSSSTFTGWSGDCSGTANPYTVTMNAAKSCVANFSVQTFTMPINVPGGNGTVSCTAPTYNGVCTCTITPATGYQLATLTDNGTNVITSVSGDSYTINNVTATHNINATYTIRTFIMPVTIPDGNGTISCTAPTYNGVCTCTITPSTGYQLATLTDNGTNVFSSVTGNSYIINNVTATHNIGATFTVKTFNKAGDCDNSGEVTIAEVQSSINMFLGLKSAEVCVNTDNSSDVLIAEVQKVINSFLGL